MHQLAFYHECRSLIGYVTQYLHLHPHHLSRDRNLELLINNYSPKAEWISVNIPLDVERVLQKPWQTISKIPTVLNTPDLEWLLKNERKFHSGNAATFTCLDGKGGVAE